MLLNYIFLGRDHSTTGATQSGVSEEGHRTITAILKSRNLYWTELATGNSSQPRQRVGNEEVVHRGVDRVNG